MVKLLYTGATKQFNPQIEPLFSLGGFVSSSLVANDFFSNLFGEITLTSIKSNVADHICLALMAEVDIENIKMTLKTTQNNQGRFRVGAVKISKDSCDVYNIPKQQNTKSKPVNISFFNCTSFYGESLIELTVNAIEGEVFEVYSDSDLIGEFIYSETYEENFIYPEYREDFSFETRFNYTSQRWNIFLIQKNLANFNPAVEVIRVSDLTSVENLTNQLPVLNEVDLGSLQASQLLALYFERTISNKTLKENRKLNCERIFSEFRSEVPNQTVEEVELEIEYDESSTTED